MNARTCHDLAELPGKAPSGGHVYVLLFDSGTVKVGSTADPRTRIRTHRLTAEGFGLSITACWVSRRFEGYLGAEGRLIAAAERMCSAVSGREWFRGVDFDALVCEAPAVTYSNPGGSALARRAPNRRRLSGRATDVMWRLDRSEPPMPAWLVNAMREQAADEDRRELREAWLFNRARFARQPVNAVST